MLIPLLIIINNDLSKNVQNLNFFKLNNFYYRNSQSKRVDWIEIYIFVQNIFNFTNLHFMFASCTLSIQLSPNNAFFSVFTISISSLFRRTPVFTIHFSAPFHAIITPLSLHQRGGVLTNLKPLSEQTISKAFAKKLLQATPPDITYI